MMAMSFLDNLHDLKEGQQLEFKTSRRNLPEDMWETYSAFANAEGGEIVLGVHEEEPSESSAAQHDGVAGSFSITGVEDSKRLIDQFWEIVINPNKVSANVMPLNGIRVHDIDGKQIVVIDVPRARRTEKPVMIREKKAMVAYIRRGSSDFRCSDDELRRMYYDASPQEDATVLDDFQIEALCADTVERYRRELDRARPGHPWAQEDPTDMLFHLRAIDRGRDQQLHPTSAGLLAFGYEHEILRRFASFHLDYREVDISDLRWIDRLDSMAGDWSGNLIDFYFQVARKLDRAFRQPFALAQDGMSHTRDTEVNDAVHEAVANALIHAYYGVPAQVEIVLDPQKLTVTNSGTFLVRKDLAIEGGLSEARNPILMRMFSLIGVSDRAGSGLQKMYRTWKQRLNATPLIEETFLPDMVRVELPLDAAMLAIWHGGEGDKKELLADGKRSYERVPYDEIVDYCRSQGGITAGACAQRFGLKPSTAQHALRRLVSQGELRREPKGRGFVYYATRS